MPDNAITNRLDLEHRASALAARGYRIQVEADVTPSGEPIWLAWHLGPQKSSGFLAYPLRRCITWGDTPAEARDNLRDACREIILSLLEDDLPVPDPAPEEQPVTGQRTS